ncbi:MAG: MFS transporter, partial [Anaerolineales bacterium]|nr:MFS transporter [Anaerolineales bacterium]
MSQQTATNRPTGMKGFMVMWFGQFISLLGSAMTGFAIPIYIFGETERVQELALLGLAFMLPLIVFSPIAGTIVDRNSRKKMMIVSDLAAGLTTIVVLLLVRTGSLEIWHLYITNAINGAFQTFQWPAYSAAISVMVPKEQYGRANGLVMLAESGSNIFAPVLAGALLGFIGLQGILLIDIVTFVFAISTLFFIFVPDPVRTVEGQKGKG